MLNKIKEGKYMHRHRSTVQCGITCEFLLLRLDIEGTKPEPHILKALLPCAPQL